MKQETADGVRSVERAASIIQAVADAGEAGARLTDIAIKTGMSKTTIHRLLGTLVKVGWLDQEDKSSTFYLGLPLVAIGNTASDRHGLLDLAAPHLKRLAELTGDTVYLAVRMGSQALCVDRVIGNFPIRTATLRIGDRRPLGTCPGSLALLAGQPQDLIEELMLSASHLQIGSLKVDTVGLPRLIAQSRASGYSMSPEVLVPGADGLGVPVMGAGGSAVAALSLETVDSRLSEPRRTQLVEWLQREAAELSENLLRLSPGFSQREVHRMLADAI
ncbi:transcriptional regulator [Paenarthrobacter histidinolovorans]|nr:transcriptional regulator [Paenarthrobacter histidinolovorans]